MALGFDVGVDLGHLRELEVDFLLHPVGQGVGQAQAELFDHQRDHDEDE